MPRSGSGAASSRIGIGRGLAAILPERGGEEEVELRELALDLISPNPSQPRQRFDAEALAALAESISATGVIQPVVVRPLPGGSYELVAGERRWRAAREAGLAAIPALVRDEDESRRLQMALVENMAREDLNPVDEARALAALVEELGLPKSEVARLVGRSRAAISNLVRLLDLPDQVIELLESGSLTEGHGRAILQAGGDGRRRALAREAAEQGWSVRETEHRARASAGEGKRGRRKGGTVTPHPDQEAARRRAGELFGAVMGRDATVRFEGSELVVELRFSSLDELLGLAEDLGTRRAA